MSTIARLHGCASPQTAYLHLHASTTFVRPVAGSFAENGMCEMRLVDAAVLTGLPFVAALVLSPASQYSMRILDTADGSWSTGMYFEESFSDSGEVVTPLHVLLHAASAIQ